MRLLIWLLVLGAVYWAVRQLAGEKPGSSAHRGNGSEMMVRDPRCGVYLPVSDAIQRRIGGETVYFCSKQCEKAYRKGRT